MARYFFGSSGLSIAIAFCLSILGSRAEAYPDLIRHNYTNCISCHVSPTGGGMLNAYGRAMSKEVLSTWSRDREEEPLHGYLPKGMIPEGVSLGGDIRFLQAHKETETKKVGRAFLMQSTLEGGITYGRVTGVISVGHADAKKRRITPVAPKYYVLLNPIDELSVRAGKFTPVFGVGVPYHTLPTRQGLGFGANSERESLEVFWSGENWSLGGSASQQRRPEDGAVGESMATLAINRNLFDSYRVGLSVLAAENPKELSRREAVSVNGLLGFSHSWAYLTEFALQKTDRDISGVYHFSQLLFEPVKGLSLYFMEDYLKSDLSDESTIEYSLGPGVRFNPRPHYEIDGYFSKKRVAAQGDRWDDSAWVVLHYYF